VPHSNDDQMSSPEGMVTKSQKAFQLGQIARSRRFAPVPYMFRLATHSSGANLGFRHIPKQAAPDVVAIDRLAPSGPHSSRTLRFPFRESSSGTIHFPLDLAPSPRYYRTTQVIYKITTFFDNLTRAQLWPFPTAELDQPDEAKTFVWRFAVVQNVRRNRLRRTRLTPTFRIFCL
jgi:hypothetical protein